VCARTVGGGWGMGAHAARSSSQLVPVGQLEQTAEVIVRHSLLVARARARLLSFAPARPHTPTSSLCCRRPPRPRGAQNGVSAHRLPRYCPPRLGSHLGPASGKKRSRLDGVDLRAELAPALLGGEPAAVPRDEAPPRGVDDGHVLEEPVGVRALQG